MSQPFGDQTVKSMPETKLRLDRVMGEIMKGKERRALVVLSLPGDRAIRANAFQDRAAIGSFGELDFQATER